MENGSGVSILKSFLLGSIQIGGKLTRARVFQAMLNQCAGAVGGKIELE